MVTGQERRALAVLRHRCAQYVFAEWEPVTAATCSLAESFLPWSRAHVTPSVLTGGLGRGEATRPPSQEPTLPLPQPESGASWSPLFSGPGTCLRKGRGKILVTSQMTPCCRAVGTQHREHLVPSGQDKVAPRGHVSCTGRGQQIFDGTGGSVLIQGAGAGDRLEADGGSFLGPGGRGDP